MVDLVPLKFPGAGVGLPIAKKWAMEF